MVDLSCYIMALKHFADFIKVLQHHDPYWPALIDDTTDLIISYGRLLELVAETAYYLDQQGIRKQHRVILYDLPGTSWVVHFLALQLLQVIVVPLDKRVHLDTIKTFFKLTTPKRIISESNDTWIQKKKLPPLSLKTRFRKSSLTYLNQLIEHFPDTETVSEILLTSGTWSQPKGVTLTQQNIMANLSGATQAYHSDHQQILLSILPLSHAYEQMCGLFMPLYVGASIVYVNAFNPEQIKNALRTRNITYLICVPKVLELLRRSIVRKLPIWSRSYFIKVVISARKLPLSARKKLFHSVHQQLSPSLTHVVIGGAKIEQDLDHFFQGLGYTTIIGYGLTETSPVISVCQQPNSRVSGGVGKPFQNLKIKINKHHEILVKGPSVFKGYWPELRKEQWFNTQDLGYLTNDNDLVLTGRSKNLIVFSNGDKLFLEDIEYITNKFPGVEESAVIYHSTHTNENINIIVHAEKDLQVLRLKKHLKQHLPTAVRIGEIINIAPNSLHRTHTMKLHRQKNWDSFSKLF